METQQRRQIKRYINLAIRRKALIAAFVLLGISIGLVVYLLQPKSYQSKALLSYQQQKINPAKMSPDQQAQIKDIVSTLSQIVTSRTSLEKIIKDVGLYGQEVKNLPMEDIVENMRKRIAITPSKQGDTFSITFMGSSPKKVARVTNMISSRFIEENLKYREERASETSAYTQNELDMAKVMLDRKEAVMRDYKMKFYNEMSEQRSANMSRLIALQEQYQNRQESIQDLERTRVLIQDQILARKQLIEENAKLKVALGSVPAKSEDDEGDLEKLVRLKKELIYMQERYTEEHPAVKRLKKIITHLETKVPKEAIEEIETISEENVLHASEPSERFDQVVSSYQIQLKDIGMNIEELSKEKVALQASITHYEKWVAAAPVREAEWSALTREYGELKRHYDYLVSQNLQARSALNLERKQKGSQFKIEDPARVPVKPVKPDFKKILGISLLIGFACGGVLAFGLELLDTSFRDPEELEEFTKLDVICTVPYVPLKKEMRRQRIKTVAGTVILIVCTAAIALAMIYFWKQGRIIL